MGRSDSIISEIMRDSLRDRSKVLYIAELVNKTKRGDYEKYSYL